VRSWAEEHDGAWETTFWNGTCGLLAPRGWVSSNTGGEKNGANKSSMDGHAGEGGAQPEKERGDGGKRKQGPRILDGGDKRRNARQQGPPHKGSTACGKSKAPPIEKKIIDS